MWSSSWVFDWWSLKFSSEGYAACAIDLQGHGGSQFKRAFSDLTVDDYATDAILTLKELAPIGSLTLLGHSMGALIAQKIASAVGARRVVLIASPDSAVLSNISLTFARVAWRYILPIFFGPVTALKQKDFQLLVGNNMDRLTAQHVFGNLERESSRVVREIGIFGTKVPTLSCPTLVVGGSQDRLLPRWVHKRVADRHSAELRMFETGHLPMFETLSGTVFAEIVSWINLRGSQ